jgi:hypothetical protein
LTRHEFRYLVFRGSVFPIVPVQLRLPGRPWLAVSALVDSGASVSLFDGGIGRSLGLTIRDGRAIRPAGIGGAITAWVHRVALKIGDEEFEGEVAFTARKKLPINLLGRAAVFDRFLVTFDEKGRRTILESV